MFSSFCKYWIQIITNQNFTAQKWIIIIFIGIELLPWRHQRAHSSIINWRRIKNRNWRWLRKCHDIRWIRLSIVISHHSSHRPKSIYTHFSEIHFKCVALHPTNAHFDILPYFVLSGWQLAVTHTLTLGSLLMLTSPRTSYDFLCEPFIWIGTFADLPCKIFCSLDPHKLNTICAWTWTWNKHTLVAEYVGERNTRAK